MSFGQHYHDEQGRREWQNPEKILERIGLEAGHTFVDVGCGEGFFSIVAARIVGPSGKVIGIDVNEEAIGHLRERVETEGLKNTEYLIEEAESARVCNRCADFVFFGIDLHDFEDPKRVLSNARDMLKPNGKLIDLDWKKREMSMGPPLRIRFDENYAARLIENAGFTVEAVEDSGKMHYLIIAKINPEFSGE